MRMENKNNLIDGTTSFSGGDSLTEKDPAAVALGRRGGLKGGRARAETLSPSRRSEIARKAAKARWAKRTDLVES